MTPFGSRLRELRADRGITMREMAQRLGNLAGLPVGP